MGWMAEFVDELADFDRRMNSAVTESGILQHVPRHALFKAGALRGGSAQRLSLNLRLHACV
jgi:hypothetical protein